MSPHITRSPRCVQSGKQLEKLDGGLPRSWSAIKTQWHWSHSAISAGGRRDRCVWKTRKRGQEKNANGDLCKTTKTRKRLEDLGLSCRWYKSSLWGIGCYYVYLFVCLFKMLPHFVTLWSWFYCLSEPASHWSLPAPPSLDITIFWRQQRR